MTLTLAIIGTVLGVLNFTWNVWTWGKSGPRVKVTVSNDFPVAGQDIGDLHVGINAANTGRAPITVTGTGIELPSKENLITPGLPGFSTPLPHRLEPGSSAAWHIPADQVWQVCRERGYSPSQLRPWIRLADDTKVYANRGPLLK
jgi:hypothetical protein